MDTNLTLHELTASPNNLKVRIALAYKGLDYERRPVDLSEFPGDRSAVLKMSRQPRLPVLQHGKTMIFDSAAIMRYLEANFPDTPPLFRQEFAEFGEVEQWELFARTQIGEPIGMVFGQAFAPESDPQVVERAKGMLAERTGVLEERLSKQDYLVGDHLTAADIACAALLYLVDLTEANAATHPALEFFARHMQLPAGREKTRGWIRRVVAYDPVMGAR